ncbi:MAG TPA: hypothetical protein VFP80_12400, partial [Thermoanaerobaculia bacterium]|nr:hypothetical protein [Thermoanaerobaculia bacterium]
MIGRLSRLPAFYRLKQEYEEPSDRTLGDDDVQALVEEYPEVAGLDLRNCMNLTGAALGHLRELRYLLALNLSGTAIDADALATLAAFPALRIVVLNETQISDEAAARLLSCRRFREISLNQTSVGNGALTGARGFRLRRLGLNGTRIDDRGAHALARFGYVGLLGVQGTGVTDDGVAALAGRDMTWTLNIAGCRVTDEGFLHLAGMRNLRHLFCDGIGITDALGERMPDVPRNLEILDAANTAIGDATVARLAACPILGRLRLFNTRITDACVPALLTMEKLELLDIRQT